LTSSNIQASPRLDLNKSLFKGASFHLGGDSKAHDSIVETISSMSMVKKIWPVRLYPRPDTKVEVFRGASAAHDAMRKREVGEVDDYAVHKMGNVDKLRAEGYTGKGIFVAVVDSGVDYLHPALGGGFGPGFKVAHGYDFVGDAYDGTNSPVQDPDPYSSCGSHGTHVSGIVGANPNPYNFTGVVPDATLGMYRVFGCKGSAGNDVLIAAFMKAHEDGADIITASIGGPSGWSEDPWAVAVARIVEAGTPCSIAAGNEGASGIFYASTAADAIGAVAVGSTDSVTTPVTSYPGTYTDASGNAVPFFYSAGEPAFPDISLELYAADFDTTNPAGGCNPYPDTTPDLSNKIVLIRRGTCKFNDKAANAAAKGAQYVMFYNNKPGAVSVTIDAVPTIKGAGMVDPDTGAALIALLKQGTKVQMAIPSASKAVLRIDTLLNNVTGGFMSTYSTWGPTFEGYIKPEVSAPGGNILSTYPLADGGYASISGTSMATPFIAGCIALMIQARGKMSPKDISALLSSTAKPVAFNDGSATQYPLLAPPIQQGGGAVDAYAAVHTKTILSVTALEFNDTRFFHHRVPFTVKNTASTSVSYTLNTTAAATTYTFPDGGSMVPSLFPPALDAAAATIKFSRSTFTLGPGQSKEITVSLTPPTGINAARLPVYGGFVNVVSSTGENLGIPYAGIGGDLRAQRIIDTEDGFPILSAAADPTGKPLGNSSSFLIHKNGNNTDAPLLTWQLAMGSRLVDITVVPEGKRASQGLGSIFGYPQTYVPRANPVAGTFLGQLASGEYVPAGKYTLRLAALKVFGIESRKSTDWEYSQTVPFEISYA
jgi:subtilisin family serine protease